MNAEFICKCGEELELENGNFKIIIEQDPYRIGTIDKKKRKTRAKCLKCGFVDEDYFQGLY